MQWNIYKYTHYEKLYYMKYKNNDRFLTKTTAQINTSAISKNTLVMNWFWSRCQD